MVVRNSIFALFVTLTLVMWGCSDETDPSTPAIDMGMDVALDATADLSDIGDDASTVDLGDDASSADMASDQGADVALDIGPDLPTGPLGQLTGDCGDIDMMEIQSIQPFVFANTIDFGMDPYDEDIDFDRLSLGGQEIILDGNAGGSSIYSEVFSYEVLFRCEMATLLKTETEVVYDTQGKITDLLVEIDARKVGVSVTRAVAFPRDAEYTVDRAQMLLEDKLADILESSANVSAEDAWSKQILHIIADENRHRDALVTAHQAIDASITADTIVVITVSEGDDDFLY